MIIPQERRTEEDDVLARIGAARRSTTSTPSDVERMAARLRSLTISPIHDASGAVIGASKIARDISAQKQRASGRRFSPEVGAVLAGSLEYLTTLKTVAESRRPVDRRLVRGRHPDRSAEG
jgi:hypothetical protein